jgi:hypothetical protein
MGYVLT